MVVRTGLVGVDPLLLGLVEPGEVAEPGDDLADPLEALAGAGDQAVEVGQGVVEIAVPLGPGDRLGQGVPKVLAVGGGHLDDQADVAVEHGQVVGHIRERVVDLVGHARHELAQAGHLLALDQVSLGLLELPEGDFQLVLATSKLLLGAPPGQVEPVPLQGPPDGRGDPRGVELVLGHIIGRPSLEHLHGHVLAPAAGHHHDRKLGMRAGLDPGQDLVAIEAGQVEVEHDEVEVVAGDPVQAGLARVGEFEVEFVEGPPVDHLVDLAVLDHQDATSAGTSVEHGAIPRSDRPGPPAPGALNGRETQAAEGDTASLASGRAGAKTGASTPPEIDGSGLANPSSSLAGGPGSIAVAFPLRPGRVASALRSDSDRGPRAMSEAAISDSQLDSLQWVSLNYYLRETNHANGLVADKSAEGSPSSIASVGLALATAPVVVERGIISREDGIERVLSKLRFFRDSPQGPEADATGYKGFYYHFLDMDTGRRVWDCELSTIDSAFLLAGMLTAATYFDRETEAEAEIRQIADDLYRRADWAWAANGEATLTHGWKPDSGFLPYRWTGYDEGLLLYILGLGSPTHPLPLEGYDAWTSSYQWKTIYDREIPLLRPAVHPPALAPVRRLPGDPGSVHGGPGDRLLREFEAGDLHPARLRDPEPAGVRHVRRTLLGLHRLRWAGLDDPDLAGGRASVLRLPGQGGPVRPGRRHDRPLGGGRLDPVRARDRPADDPELPQPRPGDDR